MFEFAFAGLNPEEMRAGFFERDVMIRAHNPPRAYGK
jgi:hypothetical protein